MRQLAYLLLAALMLLGVSPSGDPKATGSVKVKFAPEGAVVAGAQWRVDGGDWHNSGDRVRKLTPGEHTVSCKPVEGWKTPMDKAVTVVAGETTGLKRKYIATGPPAPIATANPMAGPAPLEIQFEGNANDPAVGAATYAWAFGDGGTSTEKDPVYAFPIGTLPGSYTVTFTVTDEQSAVRTTTIPVTITAGDVAALEVVTPNAPAEVVVADPESPIAQASVTVPIGAVEGPLVVTMGEDNTPPSEWLGRQPLVELGPEGTQFSAPLTVSVPVSPDVADPENVSVVAYDPAHGYWSTDGITDVQYVGGADRVITFKTTHFTFFSTLDTWTVQDLGTLGGATTYAFSINNAGKVTGYSYPFVAANWRHGILWQSGSLLTDIHDTTDKHSYGFAINDAATLQIAGYTQLEDFDEDHAAFLWDATNGKQDLGTLGGAMARAWGINDAGVVVGESTLAGGDLRAFRWTSGGGMVSLGTLGGDNSIAFAVGSAGHVVGWAEDNGLNKEAAFRWTAGGGMVKLPQHPSSEYSAAMAVNVSGNSAGEAETQTGPIHAALWTGTATITDLGTLGGASSMARSINDSNQVVGSSLIASGARRAFGWDNTGTPAMTNLNNLLPGGSNWVLIEAFDINNSGQIVGYGTHGGLTRGFLLRKN